MKSKMRTLFGCLCLSAAWTQARPADAQMTAPAKVPANMPVVYMNQPAGVPAPGTPQAPATPQAPTTPQAPGRPTPDQLAQQPQAAFGEAAPAGTEGSGSYAPQMLGDSGFIVPITVFNANPLGLQPIGPVLPSIGNSSFGGQFKFPAVAFSAVKIADNESPRPEDRAGLSTSYFTGVFHSLTSPALGENRVRVTRILLNYEKTFLNGDVSVGIRVPFFQVNTSGNDGVGGGVGGVAASSSGSQVGSSSIIAKAILAGNADTGSILVGGLVLTLPTGAATTYSVITTTGTVNTDTVNPTLWQPYLGYLLTTSDDTYVHGFSSLAFSMDDTFPTVFFNDIGVGYYTYRGANASLVATGELHLTTPLENRGSQHFPVGAIDTLISTVGAHLITDGGSRITLGAAVPWTGPKPFTWELMFQFNYAL